MKSPKINKYFNFLVIQTENVELKDSYTTSMTTINSFILAKFQD